jgi:Spy/CpxP family protein refolding chaperone
MNKARVAYCVAFLLAAMISLSAFAQNEAPPAQNPNQGMGMGGRHGHMGQGGPMMEDPQAHLDHLSRMLNLTDDQKTKILPILQDASKQSQELRQDTSLSPQDRRTKMRSIHDNTMSQIRSVLTPGQQAKLDQMKQNRGSGRGMGYGHRHGPPPASPQ